MTTKIKASNIETGAVTADKLHTTAITDKLGFTPVTPTQLTNAVAAVDLTGYATETYVNNQISSVIDAAPTALNTLNELAAALGDDANYATTITNALATKANQSTTYTKTEVDNALAGKQQSLGYTPVNKAGDTLTGDLIIEKSNPSILFKDTTDPGSADMAIGAFGENFYIYEPEDTSGTQTPSAAGRQWLRIEDDADAYIMGTRRIWDSGNAPNLGKVLKVTPYDSSTMITTSASNNFEIYSFTVTKISSTSRLYFTGAIPTMGSDNHGIYWYVAFNGTRKYAGVVDGLRSHGATSSTVPGGISINSFSNTGISAGNVTVSVGWSTLSSPETSANRPFYYINPNSSIDARNNSGSALAVWEVEA